MIDHPSVRRVQELAREKGYHFVTVHGLVWFLRQGMHGPDRRDASFAFYDRLLASEQKRKKMSGWARGIVCASFPMMKELPGDYIYSLPMIAIGMAGQEPSYREVFEQVFAMSRSAGLTVTSAIGTFWRFIRFMEDELVRNLGLDVTDCRPKVFVLPGEFEPGILKRREGKLHRTRDLASVVGRTLVPESVCSWVKGSGVPRVVVGWKWIWRRLPGFFAPPMDRVLISGCEGGEFRLCEDGDTVEVTWRGIEVGSFSLLRVSRAFGTMPDMKVHDVIGCVWGISDLYCRPWRAIACCMEDRGWISPDMAVRVFSFYRDGSMDRHMRRILSGRDPRSCLLDLVRELSLYSLMREA